MTLTELYTEYQYRIDERLGILCEDREPTSEQRKLAEKEAQEWLRRYQKENPKDGQIPLFS
jgi:hypothetical protein